ncbi:MAG TPA: hypothetical protein VFB67_13835 [Candidatus Polarisedimenticolaceae bacterium]|nr:hypothetical protein [Candidatus Polarisedimenticolaceae bacterium]
MKVCWTSVAVAILLAGCGGDGKPKDASPKPAARGPAGSEAIAGPPLRGVATRAGSTVTFRECGSPSDVAIRDAPAELAEGTTYVEWRGTPQDGGKALAVTELVRAGPVGEGSGCEKPVFAGDYLASGNEPFWSVEIGPDKIVYRSPETPQGRAYPYAFTRTGTGALVYATKSETPRVSTLEVAIEPARCVDSMSGEVRSFKAHATLDGATLEGCAVSGVPTGRFGPGALDELARFAGSYPHATSLWSQPPLEERLRALLRDKLPTFLEDMRVKSPLMKDGGVFYVIGNAAHRGGSDAAVFVADPVTDTINVVLFVRSVREDLKEDGRDIELPAEVVTRLSSIASGQ